MDKIFYKKDLLGIRIKKIQAGSTPVTDGKGSLEIVTIKHKKGHAVLPHAHKRTKRTTKTLQECIVVLKGKVRVDLYGKSTKVLKRVHVKAGEAFLTVSGGHAVHFLEASEVIEAKNGPFKNDKMPI